MRRTSSRGRLSIGRTEKFTVDHYDDEELQAATELFERWVDERLEFNPYQWTPPKTLFSDYFRWTQKGDEAAVTEEVFTNLLTRNLSVQRFQGRMMIGCGLKWNAPKRRGKPLWRRKNAIRH